MPKPSTRDQIFDAALKLLSEKGFNACSVQDITAEAGVPKGSFYNHFESKEALGVEIVEFYGDYGNLRDVLEDRSIAPMERLRQYFAGLNDTIIGRGFEQGCLLGNFSAELSDQSPLIRAQLAEIYGKWTKIIEAAIADGQADRSIGQDMDARALASFLLNAWEGATLRARAERSREAFDVFMNITFRKILI
ncbi:TetR/AcrR family transcriptional regulator [Undibacterium sp.]|jgi:TetR/AcrR family transcriptional repressor of nem operon|uniref:TetR/AcrR family transcriptional regulator n=1 Tax=Undibacterium sp. TaxID=1914977 RepID=UPI002BA1529D|nr:TetR family transcriptional regulator C-terminal domain-containing protein [Undibacterium sp.]HTD04848.1 TetR family transcriptional regulator C-terminal domain-containing protein [Undibacterium sp.]